MGIWEKMPDAFLDALRDEFGFEPPREHGCDVVDSIRAMRDGKVDVFFALGGNFAAATPGHRGDRGGARALRADRARLDQAQPLAPGHRREALILPCLGRTERDVAGRRRAVRHRRGLDEHGARLPRRLAPASPQLRSEVAIVAGLAAQLFGDDLGWPAMGDDYAVIRDAHRARRAGLRTTSTRGCSSRAGSSCPAPPHDSRTFRTATGKARFTVNPVTAVEVPPGHLLLQTIRSHDQFNTTVYGLDDRYRGIHGGRRVVFVDRRRPARARPRRRRPRRPGRASGPTASGAPRRSASSSTRRRPAAPPPTSRRRTSWSRWTPPPRRATPRRRSRSSSASTERLAGPRAQPGCRNAPLSWRKSHAHRASGHGFGRSGGVW